MTNPDPSHREVVTEVTDTVNLVADEKQDRSEVVAREARTERLRTAEELAALVVETASEVKNEAVKNAKILKNASDVNSEMTKLLMRSLEVLQVTVKELSASSLAAQRDAERENRLLRSRTKYFILILVMQIATLALIVLDTGFLGNR